MAHQPYPTCEFSNEQEAAFALTGTVALPSPFPASARIFIGIMPRLYGSSAERYYLKIVQVITDKLIVTQFVNLDYLRAVRLRPESGRYDDLREWTLRVDVDLHKELEDAKETLKQAAKETLKQAASETRGAYEFLLFPEHQGVVYVPETAPVLVRTEYGVVAAEASESGCFTRMAPTMHCCAEPVPPWSL